LRNTLERAALLCDGTVLEVNHITQALRAGRRHGTSIATPGANDADFRRQSAPGPLPQVPAAALASPGVLDDAARSLLAELSRTHMGSRAELAAKLGISERSLYRKLKALKLP
jgi:DNA-binding NtrC family response regulator